MTLTLCAGRQMGILAFALACSASAIGMDDLGHTGKSNLSTATPNGDVKVRIQTEPAGEFSESSKGSRCTQPEAQAAENQVPTAKNWYEIHEFYREYQHCDDGAIAEGFSEVVTLQPERSWKTVQQLGHLTRQDPGFHTFVIAHINASVPAERLTLIQSNASKSCPHDLQSLCRAIQVAAETAVK
jgi:hypothetical protein